MSIISEKNTFEEIVFRSLFDATARLRTTVFANLLLCAIVLCNVYTQWNAYDDHQLATSYEKLNLRNGRIKEIEEKNRCPASGVFTDGAACKPDTLVSITRWPQKDRDEINEALVRKSRAENMLRDYVMPSVTLPLVNFKLSTNDLHPIAGGFMCIIALWAFMTARQIYHIYSDPNPAVRTVILKYADALSHAFATASHDRSRTMNAIITGVIFFPALSLVVAIYWDVYSLLEIFRKDNPGIGWDEAFKRFVVSEPLNNHLPLFITAIFALLIWKMSRATRTSLLYVYDERFRAET